MITQDFESARLEGYGDGLHDGFRDGFLEAVRMVETGSDLDSLREWATYYLDETRWTVTEAGRAAK